MADRNKSRITQKTLHVIFAFINIFLGFNLGYTYIKSSSKILKLTAKILQLIQITVVLVVVYFYSGIIENQYILEVTWYISFNMQYLTCTLVSQYCDEQNSFFTFQTNLFSIDCELGVPGSMYNIEMKLIIALALSLLLEATFLLYNCFYTFYCETPFYYIILIYCPVLVAKILLVVYTFVFYSSYCRMKTLTRLVSKRGNDCSHCSFIYDNLADATEKARCNFSCMFFWVLAYFVAYMMESIFYPLLTQLNSAGPVWQLLMTNVIVIPTLIMIFAPMYTASLLASQVQEMKLILYNRLIDDRDEAYYGTLRKFVRYIEARPFKFTIAKIIPLDWSLVAMVLNAIITYVIVLLQMSTRKNKM